MPVPTLSTPTADQGITYTAVAGAPLMVDLTLTPYGDLALVTGIDRLMQDVTKFLYTPVGADPFNPDYGNALLQELGQPLQADLTTYTTLLQQAEAEFIARQQADAAQGFLSLDEQLDHFDSISVQYQNSQLVISMRVISKSGNAANTSLTLNG